MANFCALSSRSILTLSLLLLCIAPPRASSAQKPSSQTQQGPNAPRVSPVPSFAFGWKDGRASFRAGDTAAVTIWAFDLPDDAAIRSQLSFSATVNGKRGNSTYITDVAAHLDGEPPSWNFTFVPIRAGSFFVLFREDWFCVSDSVLKFTVAAGDVHPTASVVSWMYYSGYVAGTKAFLSVLSKDAFGNGVARGTDMPGAGGEYFRVSVSYANGTAVEFLDFQYNGWTEEGCVSLEFVSTVAGDFLVQVYGDNVTLRGSPLSLTVKPAPLDIVKCTGSWKHGTNILQIFSKLEIFINQKDTSGNSVPEIQPFDAAVVGRASNLSVPVVDLQIEAVAEGNQLLSFNIVKPGEFVLTIFDDQLNQRLSNMVYMYDVFVGYCDGSNSFANGSGLAHSVAGSVSSFMVYVEDQCGNPSPIETAVLQVKILSKNGTSDADPIIAPLREQNETIYTEVPSSWDHGLADHQKMIAGNSAVQASHFNVSYTPQLADEYDIWVLCGNIVLNNGNPYAITVSPGALNTSLSRVLMFDPRVKRSARNEVTVRLVDSFMNPIVSLESKLKLQLTSANVKTPLMNMSSFMAWEFVNNKDGSYTAHYVAKHLGSHSMCIQFENEQLPPCPLVVHVLAEEYFSEVQNDSISVWEDESVSFDFWSNDYIAGGQAEVVNFSSALHGSVIQDNQIYPYTPFEGFFGNDSFSYTISDKHKNVVSGTVFVYVLPIPPRLIVLPQ